MNHRVRTLIPYINYTELLPLLPKKLFNNH